MKLFYLFSVVSAFKSVQEARLNMCKFQNYVFLFPDKHDHVALDWHEDN